MKIVARLGTRDGFWKTMTLPQLFPAFMVPMRPKHRATLYGNIQAPFTEQYESINFYLQKHKVVKDKKGREYIVAVYRE